ncbi:histidinol dehydrogenase [Dictyobacter arantiisoli]|uniref:histidinol dehydrogenase n=1 Tax=Dictyobacter arantiisoli TaxID=2014874 RepID=A0A5A5TG39_9CHLR|nr:histidinol dehydrogenase [Dictyobacter arantiisoli]GCF10185.1 histidinol dehydrogenase [Dictyobacter arantiisoli]
MVHTYELTTLDKAQRGRLLRRAEVAIDDLLDYIRPVVHDVRDRGDAALIDYMERFDHVHLTADQFRVSHEEIARAHDLLDKDVYQAIKHAIKNVRTFHERQMPHEQWFTEVAPGVMAGEKITPISSVGLYVPRGKGSFPSVVYMLATPASIAGVPRIVICTPPAPNGEVDPATLVAADLCGVHEVYRVAGAQAIAALAYGTETIARVHKVTGPGSPYVSAAKRLLYGTLDVGLPAGPSEAAILADESADPELVVRDLMVEAEHGPDSSSILVTNSRALLDAVKDLLPARIASLPEPRQTFCRTGFEGEKGTGGLILAPNLSEAIAFVNEYAPEHLLVHMREPFAVLPELRNAGEILLGSRTSGPLANYSLGINAILPTGGFAHTFSCTSVFDFLKRTSLGYVTAEGYGPLSDSTRILADFEGFPSHARAVTDRPEARF